LAIVAPDAVATIIHTGGSTGEPRGVVRTHRNLVSRGWAFFPWEGNLNDPPPSDELLFQPLSLCHSAGRWWCHLALAGGRTLALPSTGMETLSLDELQRLSPTHIASVPRVVLQLQKLLMPHMGDLWERLIDAGDVDGDDLRSQFAARLRGLLGGRLRRIEWGGGPLARTLHAFFEEQGGIALACGYGGTEIGSVAIQDEIRTFGTAGRPVAANVRIDSGEILVRGPGVTPGYYKNPVATARAQADRGWWRTGDVGRFDEAGNLVVMGRVNAMFNCHEGTNIDPTELEQLLESDVYISQAILIGDRRPYLAALLVVDPERIDTSRAEAVVQERIARINRDLESYEQIRRFAIVDVPFPDAVRQITGARKVRIDRAAVDRTYKETIDRLYADQ
jgi:long-chain acyl-CoA synthetase